MDAKCEVIGWLLLDPENAQVLVREEDGHVSHQTASFETALGHEAIQTGVFRRGNPILDPVTHQTVGYELERIWSAVAASA